MKKKANAQQEELAVIARMGNREEGLPLPGRTPHQLTATIKHTLPSSSYPHDRKGKR